jgi:hypothetical protein
MIDNIELIKPLLNFTEKGDFYMLYVFKRKKDQPEGERDNHQSVRTIKTYCVDSVEYIEKRYDEVKQLCEMFKARAYIHVQKQNHRDVSLEMMVALAEKIRNGQNNQKGLFDSVVGQIKTYEKRWIVDVDSKDTKELFKIKLLIDSCAPFGKDKIVSEIPTKNGYHLITDRFDVLTFNKMMSLQGDVPDIQKKNPTLLFLPESLSD